MQSQIKQLEVEFYNDVNRQVSTKITPLYNVIVLLFASIFAYFLVLEQPQCYAKDSNALNRHEFGASDVTNQFYWLSLIGMVILLLQSIVYYSQARDEMYYTMRPMVIFINLISFVWFISIQYFRFKETGRACSGDFVNVGVAKYLNRKGENAITATKEEQKNLLAD